MVAKWCYWKDEWSVYQGVKVWVGWTWWGYRRGLLLGWGGVPEQRREHSKVGAAWKPSDWQED